jgi:hypothetical protein
MVFFLLSFFSVALAGNCAPGLVNSGGLITIGDNQASTFTLSPGTSICLHTYFTAPAVSTLSNLHYLHDLHHSFFVRHEQVFVEHSAIISDQHKFETVCWSSTQTNIFGLLLTSLGANG